MPPAILAGLAILPGIVLMIYIFKKDKVEKEPARLLALLFIFGALAVIPVFFAELLADDLICSLLNVRVLDDGRIAVLSGSVQFKGYLYKILNNLLGIALIEEVAKFLVLYLITRNNKNFNCLFDGIIYSVFVSLGFATVENLMYVMGNGFSTALFRMVLSVPGHFFYSVIMGIFYSWWKIYRTANCLEKEVKSKGFIPKSSPEFKSGAYIIIGIGIPVIFHGLYDFGCSIKSLLIPFLTTLAGYLVIFKRVSVYSKHDGLIAEYSLGILLKKYPKLDLVAIINSESPSASSYSRPQTYNPYAAPPAEPKKEAHSLEEILSAYNPKE